MTANVYMMSLEPVQKTWSKYDEFIAVDLFCDTLEEKTCQDFYLHNTGLRGSMPNVNK